MLVQRKLQGAFANAIFDIDCAFPDDIVSHVTRHPLRRFNVYRNNVTSSLVDVLQAYFPVVDRLVGTEFFRAMARTFVTNSPPTSPILSRYGADFPAFLQTFQPVEDLPYLPDVARLEWFRQRAYHAADMQPLEADDLNIIELNQIRDIVFRPHASAALLASSYPVVSIWRTNTQDDAVTSINADAGPEFALVVRLHLAVHVVPLPADFHRFASALFEGMPLGAAAAEALVAFGTFDLQQALATLIERGALAGAKAPSGESVNWMEAQW